MENLSVVLPKSQKTVPIRVDRKKMKTCRLKIYPDQTAIISVPFGVTDDWIQSFDNKVRYLVLIGQTAKTIAETAKKYGFESIIFEDNLESAVMTCHKLATEGEAVLLSPACASWGQFDNYEQRGDMFKEYVRAL